MGPRLKKYLKITKTGKKTGRKCAPLDQKFGRKLSHGGIQFCYFWTIPLLGQGVGTVKKSPRSTWSWGSYPLRIALIYLYKTSSGIKITV